MGVINLKWRDAMRVAGYAFDKAEQDAGWPERMNALQLAAMQRLRYFTPVKRMMEPDPFDPAANAQIEQNRANNVLREALHCEFEAGRGPDTPQAFAAWLAAQGEAPSVHTQAWFEAVGVAGIAQCVPATSTTTPSAPAQDRRHKRRDLLAPLIETAQKACQDPNDAAAVFTSLRTWAQSKPPRPPLVGVTGDGRIQWSDSNDTPKELSSKALAKRLIRQGKAAPKTTS